MSKKVLIVDDERNIVDILNHNLVKEGYATCQAYDGEQAVEVAKSEKPDLILLDVMLPKKDGFSVCKEIRQTSSVPILMVTAKEDVVDKIIGLELGADDYITKPFSVREVIARVKANLRKTEKYIGNNQGNGNPEIKFGALSLDVDKYEVKVNEKNVDLTLREFELLKFLATQKGQVFSREELLEKVWGYEYFGDTRTIDIHITRLRKKLDLEDSIITVFKYGYRFKMKED